jgi:hypothetical protein
LEEIKMPYDDMMYRVNTAAASLSGVEWFVVFSFVAFGIVYFLAPVLGYDGQHRGMLSFSLYLLLGYGVLALVQVVIAYLIYLGSSNSSTTAAKAAVHLATIFAILKLIVFLAAQGCFILGIQGLRRNAAH